MKQYNNIINRFYLLSIIDILFIRSIIPINITYMWNFGCLLGSALIYQIISGIFLAFHYIPTTKLAFKSIQNIMIEENLGYLLRYSHSNGASIFFILVYLHISRSLFYESYRAPRILVYNIGVIIYILMMLTAFLGYVIVWGSMSLWGAIVITNFITIIPWIGIILLLFIWGGFSVELPTLERFYVLHFSLPWIILLLTLIHIFSLHYKSSNNDLAINIPSFNKFFHPLFTFKDLNTLILLFVLYLFLIGFIPNYLGHPDNYIKANPMITPSSIVPEWYFLPFYAILRSFPNKVIGVLLMGLSIAILFLLPILITTNNRGNNFKILFKIIFYIFVINLIALLLIGNLPVQYPFITIGTIFTYIYFLTISILPGLLSDINNLFSNYYYYINNNK